MQKDVHKRRTTKKKTNTRIKEKMIVETTRTMAKSATLLKKKIMMRLSM